MKDGLLIFNCLLSPEAGELYEPLASQWIVIYFRGNLGSWLLHSPPFFLWIFVASHHSDLLIKSWFLFYGPPFYSNIYLHSQVDIKDEVTNVSDFWAFHFLVFLNFNYFVHILFPSPLWCPRAGLCYYPETHLLLKP